jgi:hypothetical protein
MNLANQLDRINLIGSINSENNKSRKQWSLRQFNINGGRIQQYVKESLQAQLQNSTVVEMPIVSSINVQKAVTDKKATIYKKRPERVFTEVTDEQQSILELIYRDMKSDMKLNKANKNFIYQDQSIGMIVPKNGKLIMRVFAMHQIDAIVDPEDPEGALGFVLSVFDRTDYDEIESDRKEKDVATGNSGRSVRSTAMQDNDYEVAEKYQYQKYVEKYIVWTKDLNFMMNGLGEVIDPETGEASNEVDIASPLASEGIMPFFEVAREKDFEFFVRPSNALTDFTIQFNERLSDLAMNQKMNGYAVAILKSPSTLKPQNLVVGHSQLIHLATDDPEAKVDFSFASPESNIADISDANDRFLNYFITSEGLGGDVVNSKGETKEATSGIDRFLQAIQKIEAHQDDYEAFRCAEDDIYRIVKAWLRVLTGDKQLDKKYQIANISEDSEVEIDFYKPEMMQTQSELITNIREQLELELMSRKEAIMELREITDDDKAQEILDMIDKENAQGMTFVPPSETSQDLEFDATVDDDEEEEELEVQE